MILLKDILISQNSKHNYIIKIRVTLSLSCSYFFSEKIDDNVYKLYRMKTKLLKQTREFINDNLICRGFTEETIYWELRGLHIAPILYMFPNYLTPESAKKYYLEFIIRLWRKEKVYFIYLDLWIWKTRAKYEKT